MDETGLGSCTVVGFSINDVKLLDSRRGFV